MMINKRIKLLQEFLSVISYVLARRNGFCFLALNVLHNDDFSCFKRVTVLIKSAVVCET